MHAVFDATHLNSSCSTTREKCVFHRSSMFAAPILALQIGPARLNVLRCRRMHCGSMFQHAMLGVPCWQGGGALPPAALRLCRLSAVMLYSERKQGTQTAVTMCLSTADCTEAAHTAINSSAGIASTKLSRAAGSVVRASLHSTPKG